MKREKIKLSELSIDNFFNQMSIEELDVFEKLYKSRMFLTTNDIISGERISDEIIEKHHNTARVNLEKIEIEKNNRK